jgi:hypothetical protein
MRRYDPMTWDGETQAQDVGQGVRQLARAAAYAQILEFAGNFPGLIDQAHLDGLREFSDKAEASLSSCTNVTLPNADWVPEGLRTCSVAQGAFVLYHASVTKGAWTKFGKTIGKEIVAERG